MRERDLEELEEFVYPPLAQKLYADAFKIGQRVAKDVLKHRDEIRKLRHALEDQIKTVKDIDIDYSCITVDSSYTTSLISLVSITLGAIAYGYYVHPHKEKAITGEVVEYPSTTEDIIGDLSIYCRSMERKVVIDYLMTHDEIHGVIFLQDARVFFV